MTVVQEEDEFSELYEADLPRVDGVGKGANGVPRWLLMKQADGASHLDAGFVRDLIAKSAPGDPAPSEGTVTMSGTPAAIASLINGMAGAPIRKAEMSGKAINDLPDSAFAYIEPGGHKDDEGKTVPRSKRHFPVHDAAHTRNALSRAPQSPFGDKAMPKIRAAAKRFGIDVAKALAEDGLTPEEIAKMTAELDDGIDGLDPTVPLASPEGDAPGDPADPGSPAWEAIDAATAQKWIAIASRLKNALCVMADRELIEAAAADPSDAVAAWDLQDAQCAVDYVISTLAVFAAGEQAEADLAAEAMAGIAKALAGFDEGPLGVIEGLSAVAKSGRVLSSANENLIKTAAESLQKVLASLPAAPAADDSGQMVAKQEGTVVDDATASQAEPVEKEDAVTEPESPEAVAKDAATETAPAEPEGEPAAGVSKAAGLRMLAYDKAGAPVTVSADAISATVIKADGKPSLVAVFDANGCLVGAADPADITPLANVQAPEGNKDDDDGEPDQPASEADPADMTPAPPADAGIPADGPPDDDVAKQQDSQTPDTGHEVLKSLVTEAVGAALDARGPAQDTVTKADAAALRAEIDVLKTRVVALGEQPAMPKVFANGQVPQPGQMRGQDRAAGAAPVDVAKAAELKRTLYSGSGPEQRAAADEMQRMAIEKLAELHRR